MFHCKASLNVRVTDLGKVLVNEGLGKVKANLHLSKPIWAVLHLTKSLKQHW